MKCKEEFNRKFLIENLCQSFVNGPYRKSRDELLFGTEHARLSEDMEAAALVQTSKEIKRENIRITEQIRKLTVQKRANEGKIWQAQRIIDGKEIITNKKEFIQQCPGENCNGLLSTHWRCKICSLQLCGRCHTIKGYIPQGIKPTEAFPNHVCKQEDIDSVQEIKRITKKCPTCGTSIQKSAGCDQMWCTKCHVAFSWRNLNIIRNAIIHNPHFVEYKKQQLKNGTAVRAPGDVVCGGIPYWSTWSTRVIHPHLPPTGANRRDRWGHRRAPVGSLANILAELWRSAGHVQNVIVYNLRAEVTRQSNNRDLRIKFILGEITKDSMKQTLSRRAITKEKSQAMLHIYELINTIITENINHILNNPSKENCFLCINNCHNIRTYANEELKKVSILYSQSVKLLNKNFQITGEKYTKKRLRLEQEATKKLQNAAAATEAAENATCCVN